MTNPNYSSNLPFEQVRTLPEANAAYVRGYLEAQVTQDNNKLFLLYSAYRNTVKRLGVDNLVFYKSVSPIEGSTVRNWAKSVGIPVQPTGRVPKSLYSAYRAAHNLPMEHLPQNATLDKHSVSASDVRKWAREANVKVGVRGRLNPDLIEAFKAARMAGKSDN